MRNSLSLWLTGIIVLTILAFLAVFKPLTLAPRKDPLDASRYLRPVSVSSFDAGKAPDGTFTVFNQQIYVYKPQHDLRLGLDLRGGMRVVLTIPDLMHYDYNLTDNLEIAQATAKQKELIDALSAPGSLGEKTMTDEQVNVVVSGNLVNITTEPKNTAEGHDQYRIIGEAMTKVFGADKYAAQLSEAKLFDAKAMESQKKNYQDQVLQIMEQRLNKTGTTEVNAYAEGQDRIVLEIPGVKDPETVRLMLRTTAQLEFRLIPRNIMVNVDDMTGVVTATETGGKQLTNDDAIKRSFLVITGANLNPDSAPTYNQAHQPAVSFSIKPNKQQFFGAITAGHQGDQLAIVLDHKIVMAPVIRAQITSNGIIEGNFTMDEAKQLSVLLNAGALPVPVQIEQTQTVSATLGADSIHASMIAGLIGLAMVLIFMAAYYRLPGLMANMALIIYIFLSLAVLKFFDATLTLPGIAGIIISIGMAVDANVIIFERLKEELRTQKPLETAIDVAFSRAWTAILDSNVASLITGSVLYAMGSGAVKGFAVTLLIGVAVSMFTAVTVTRLFMKLMIRSKAGHKLAWYGV